MLNTSVKDLAEKIRSKDISALELTQFYIDRIEQHNGLINAVIAERFDRALSDARLADKMVRADAC